MLDQSGVGGAGIIFMGLPLPNAAAVRNIRVGPFLGRLPSFPATHLIAIFTVASPNATHQRLNRRVVRLGGQGDGFFIFNRHAAIFLLLDASHPNLKFAA